MSKYPRVIGEPRFFPVEEESMQEILEECPLDNSYDYKG